MSTWASATNTQQFQVYYTLRLYSISISSCTVVFISFVWLTGWHYSLVYTFVFEWTRIRANLSVGLPSAGTNESSLVLLCRISDAETSESWTNDYYRKGTGKAETKKEEREMPIPLVFIAIFVVRIDVDCDACCRRTLFGAGFCCH